ncbi:MAG: hypothetical protein EPO32_07850 [Anaerolineae bacterium]|nr:MAG: hypothetical protein EPO32_07850 [Anaerolineae bacterium]
MANRNPARLAACLLLAGLSLLPQQPAASAPLSEKSLDLGAPAGYELMLLPEDGLYPGEKASFILLPPPDADLNETEFTASRRLDGEPVLLGAATFGGHGIGRSQRATLRWVWNTAGLSAGKFVLYFQLAPEGPAWSQVFTLRRPETQPPAQRDAAWEMLQTDCCILYYMTGTAGHRDLEDMADTADAQAESVSARMGVDFAEPVTVVLLPRTLGHGGFATSEIYVSYLDRNYAGSDFSIVLHHEMVHILDLRLGGELRPSMLVEGLATYLTGGHFKAEPLLPRAAALPELGWYVPLRRLTDNFYFEQHEVGYLQAAALIEYMVERWGYDAFDAFYRDIHPVPEGSQSDALDAALQEHFALTLDDLEVDFMARLAAEEVTAANREDVRLMVMLFDTVRRYQQVGDPNAYFLSAWLLSIEDMQTEDITADYARHPNSLENQALEALLAAAEDALRLGNTARAEELLAAVNVVLAALESGKQPTAAMAADPLAADALAVVQALHAQGYEIQSLVFEAGRAWAHATQPRTSPLPALVMVELVREGDGWAVVSANR